MGECIIARNGAGSGGGVVTDTNLPVLNGNHPKDNLFKYGSSITLSCLVDMYHANCIYQWYCDDIIINNASSNTYTITAPDKYSLHSYYCRVTNNIGSVYSRTALIESYPSIINILNEGVVDFIKFDSNITHNIPTIVEKEDGMIGDSRITKGKTTTTTNIVPFSLYNKIYLQAFASSWVEYDAILSIYCDDLLISKVSMPGQGEGHDGYIDISNINVDGYMKLSVGSNNGVAINRLSLE